MFAVIGANNECYFNDNSFSSVAPALNLAIESFGLNALMLANVTSGPSNLGVQFQSISTPGTGIESWEWDLNGDGEIDSTEEDPYFLYTEQGTYNVTLTVTMDGETSTLTNNNYITVTDASSIAGNLSGIWKVDFAPYNVVDAVEIGAGDQLMIEPGVEVTFGSGNQLMVYGSLIADGISRDNEPVILTSSSSWSGIKFNGTQEDNIIRNCEISKVDGCAIAIANDSYVDIIGNKIFDNNSASLGAAIDIDASDNVLIAQNIIANNTSSNLVGGIGCIASSVEIKNNIIVNNTGTYGAFSLKNGSDALLENNTIANNESTSGTPYLFFLFNAIPTLINNIVIDNGTLFFAPFGDPTITYTCISGGFTGEGNIDEDPLFVAPSEGDGVDYDGLNASWWLNAGSLCIDVGNPDAMYNDPDGSRNDMGAYGGPEALFVTVGANPENIPPVSHSTFSVYPNPFNPVTSIALSISDGDKTKPVSVNVYNLKGQLVKTLVDNEIVSNTTVIWNGTDNSGDATSTGMYFVKLSTATETISHKVMLLK